MDRRVNRAITACVIAGLSLGGATAANAQRTTNDSTRVTSQMRIPVRKDVTRTESAGAIATDSTAMADSLERERMLAAERMRQDSLAALERARQDSLAMIERARQDSIAREEALARARADSIARADSLMRLAAMRRRLPSSVYFNLSAGASVPTGYLNDLFKTGWNATASLGWHPVNLPFGLRLDAGYDRLMGRTITGTTGPVELDDQAIWSGLGEVTLKVPRLLGVSPYIVGGGGVYHFSSYGSGGTGTTGGTTGGGSGYSVSTSASSVAIGDGGSTTKGGWNAGGGLAFGWGRTQVFVESRYMRVNTPDDASTFVPIVLGVTFR